MSNTPMQEGLEGVAVIGMSGRFPGARNVEEFWNNLKEGKESITYFTPEEARACGIDEELTKDPNYVFAGGILEDIDLFDAEFFGMNPREAKNMDPQQRMFLECCYEALEDGGYSRNRYEDPVGVYAGSNMSYYFLYHLMNKLGVKDDLAIAVGNDKDYLSTRASYEFNFKGPSVNIQTACSTSMAAIAMAYEGLLNYHCDMALAGGAGLKLPQKSGYLFQTGFIGSPDGHTRPFDADACGTVFTSAVGVVVMKRLEDALRDGDHIYGVIRGMAVNNDGSDKVGFTAPSREGQAQVIAAAQNLAGVNAEDIGFMEAHGTGTSLGDPIEISALTKVFEQSTRKRAYCAIGSVKGNIGHAISGAGVAGMIKTLLALKHKQIPPSINFTVPNSKIDFENSAFYVNTSLAEWRTEGRPRLAGVSSFGFGGTNVHAVVEEAPALTSSPCPGEWQLLTLSARSREALEEMRLNLARHFRANPQIDFADAIYTLHVGRKEFDCRRAIVCSSLEAAVRLLEGETGEGIFEGTAKADGNTGTEVRKLMKGMDGDEKSALAALARLWTEGAAIDWEEFHRDEKRLRVPLPTYPFQRKRYWVEQYDMKAFTGNTGPRIENKPGCDDWLYLPTWHRAPNLSFDSAALDRSGHWLIFTDETGLGLRVKEKLEQKGIQVVAAAKGEKFCRLNACSYTVNPAIKEDYTRLGNELFSNGIKIVSVLHLWGTVGKASPAGGGGIPEDIHFNGLYSLIFLVQAFSRHAVDHHLRLSVITNDVHSVTGGEKLSPEKAAVLGACKVIPMEYANIFCQHIDVASADIEKKKENLAEKILAEIGAQKPALSVGLRGVYRWLPALEKVAPEEGGDRVWLEDRGTYLITGGLGGIGLEAAEYMAQRAKINLVLTGRSGLPGRDGWEEWLEKHPGNDVTGARIKKIKAIERLGSRVMIAQADAADAERMTAVVLEAEASCGRINGVLHAAGISDNGLIEEKTVETASRVLRPKYTGTWVLDKLFEDRDLDFMVLFSSSSSILGEAGFVDYCGANAFLDAYAHYRTLKTGSFTTAIGWDEWAGIGMAVNTNSRSRREKITVQEGLRLLERIVRSKTLLQVIVAPGDFPGRLKEVEDFRRASLSGKQEAGGEHRKANNRPELATPFEAPRNKVEEAIAGIWQEQLGIYPIGVKDDFFELGGHSLLATTMISILRKEFRKNISLQGFLESSTVESLAHMFGSGPGGDGLQEEEFEQGRL